VAARNDDQARTLSPRRHAFVLDHAASDDSQGAVSTQPARGSSVKEAPTAPNTLSERPGVRYRRAVTSLRCTTQPR
jgi:hypothetical protein